MSTIWTNIYYEINSTNFFELMNEIVNIADYIVILKINEFEKIFLGYKKTYK